MDYKRLTERAVLAGESMQKSGAETYRVEETMNRILQTSNLKIMESFAISTGIVATLADPSIDTITMVKRVKDRENNLGRIHQVNSVSRDYCDGKISMEEAYQKLSEIEKGTIYPAYMLYLAQAGVALPFVLMFGGGPWELLGALCVSPMLLLAIWTGDRLKLHTVLKTILNAFTIGFFSLLVTRYILPQADNNLIIISSIMLLVPGAPFTNAIRDILYGDYSSGTSRIMESILTAVSVAIGIGVSMGILSYFWGGLV